jgi:hypothetical protein
MPDRPPRNRRVKGPQPIQPITAAEEGAVIRFLRSQDVGRLETAADIARANRKIWRAMVTGKLPTALAFRWIIAGRTVGAQTREQEERELFEKTQKEWREVHGLGPSGAPQLPAPNSDQPLDGEFIPRSTDTNGHEFVANDLQEN